MTDDEMQQDIDAAINERLQALRDRVARRRAHTNAFSAAKKTRRDAGLKSRHARKIQRATEKENQQ